MKVLSIRKPYATLIKNKIKYVGTITWKTNYRGKVLTHSSKSKYQIKDKVKHLIYMNELTYGYILFETELVDCIYIDKNYAEKMKRDNLNNYLCEDRELVDMRGYSKTLSWLNQLQYHGN